ncbi:UNVERIFIED_CONTAM: hypothetical protein PYX00_008419 [Menopon gallinae]|uniref:Acyltransferase 3 domain-containing protein n=1 Tax=Menopon gallinae TaxID=328185 RepID=A0AAW2HMW7_9NEOP
MAFSLRRNVPTLLDRDEGGDSRETNLLYGVRFYNVCYVVTDHRVTIAMSTIVFNPQLVEWLFRTWQNMFLPAGDLFIDTFFFVGGLLAALNLLDMQKYRSFHPIRLIVHRFLRLAPLYYFVIWFQASALARFGSGPAWNFGLKDEIAYCQKNWWANVLFIQNYVTSNEMCMLHAWYLPCDFHFFIVAVLITSIIKKNKAAGVALLYVATILSIVTPGLITYFYELNPTVEFQPEFLEKPREDMTFQLLYVKSHTRISVYLLGMITAYHLFNSRKSTWKISNTVSTLGCILGLALLFAPMAYGGPTYYNPRRTYDVIQASMFASVRRLLWGLAWVLFLFINRFGVIPIFGNVFTWRISVPLSKVTYAVYLIHFIMQIADQAKVRIPYQFIPFDMFVKGTNDLFFSVGYAFVLYLVLELPFRLLFKELLFPKKPKTNPEKYPQRITIIQDDLPKVQSAKL